MDSAGCPSEKGTITGEVEACAAIHHAAHVPVYWVRTDHEMCHGVGAPVTTHSHHGVLLILVALGAEDDDHADIALVARISHRKFVETVHAGKQIMCALVAELRGR